MQITINDGYTTFKTTDNVFEVIDSEGKVVIREEYENKLGAFLDMVTQLWANWEGCFDEECAPNFTNDIHQFKQADMIFDLLAKIKHR